MLYKGLRELKMNKDGGVTTERDVFVGQSHVILEIFAESLFTSLEG
jgi:hypothetical protein